MASWELAADIGERLKELRLLRRWTQEELAAELGRAKLQATLWEGGKAKPPKRKLEELAAKYRWPISIFAEDGPRPAVHVKPEPAVLTPRAAVIDVRVSDIGARYGDPREAAGEPEGAGWQFGDPSAWDEEQLLTVLGHAERTFRATMSYLGEPGIRELRITALRQMIARARESGRPLKDFAFRILHELESGQR